MSLATGDLTTLAAVKSYITAPAADAVISGLITRISGHIRAAMNRGILVPTTYTQQFSGQGTQQLVLPEWPLLSLTSLKIDGLPIPVSPQVDDPSSFNVTYGYRFQPWSGVPPGNPAVLDLIGYSFRGGLQNTIVSYVAGYQVTGEAQTIPAVSTFTVVPNLPFGSWATDRGVVNATTGAVLTSTTNPAPAAGQYLPPNPALATPRLNYTFNSADANTPILLSYGFIPAEVEQACIELIMERSAYRSRVGIRSQSLASQETIVYDLGGISKYVQEVLRDYVSVLPPAIGAPV